MTTIQVSDETWSKLNAMKQRGETMDDVVRRLIQLSGGNHEQNDDRSFEEIVDEFVSLQPGIEEIIERSKKSYGKEISE